MGLPGPAHIIYPCDDRGADGTLRILAGRRSQLLRTYKLLPCAGLIGKKCVALPWLLLLRHDLRGDLRTARLGDADSPLLCPRRRDDHVHG